MADKSIVHKSIQRISSGKSELLKDAIAIEEPLSISLTYNQENNLESKDISITMRTPGNDKSLAVGFLFTEGIIHNFDQIDSIQESINQITVSLKPNIAFDIQKLDRHFYTTSSCGVCGKSSIDALYSLSNFEDQVESFSVNQKTLFNLVPQLNKFQNVFQSTGGLHAATLFHSDGQYLDIKEDVGRHNALDKIIGAALIEKKIPLNKHILLLSGRASFELIQKSYMAGISFIVAVGAPSSLAIELAEEKKMTLVGFMSENRFNVYCDFGRVDLKGQP